MDQSRVTDQRNENINQRLKAACEMLEKDWDQRNQSWNTYDHNWYNLSSDRLYILADSLQLFIQSSKIDINVEWLIATKTYDILKNILLHPDDNLTSDQITPLVWQLMFELTRNSDNHVRIWNDFKEFFFDCLQSAVYLHKDICRLSIYNIYRFGRIAPHDDSKLLNIILQNFHDEVQEQSSRKQGLNVFLEYFIVDNKQMSTIYRHLDIEKRLWLLQIVAEHIDQGHFKVLPISIDLLMYICEAFKEKNIDTNSKSVDNVNLLELLALFKVIAYASNETYYEMNYLEDDLLCYVGQFLTNLSLNETLYEDAFLVISGVNCNTSLKIMVLKTISNLVRGSQRNQNLVREKGILANIVEFLCLFGKDQAATKIAILRAATYFFVKQLFDPIVHKINSTLFNLVMYAIIVLTIIDICDMNVANEEYIKHFVTKRNDGNSEILRTLMIDVKYKKNRTSNI